MSRTYRLVVGPKEANLRLDRYLLRHLPQTLSRASVQRAIRQGMVTVEGCVAKVHRHLKAGEMLVVRLDQLSPPRQETKAAPEAIPLDVVYEDDALLVVNKPPGLVTHPAPGHWSGTLVNAVLWHLNKNVECGMWNVECHRETPQPEPRIPHLPRAGIVHRLDKDTSGLLVVAKTEHALRALAKQLKARTLSRRYLALVEGLMEFDEGTIETGIGRHLKDRKVMAVRYLGARQAVTHYRVLKRFGGEFPYTLLEVRLETGRTHQVRVHLAHVGHPVLGDAVYSRHPATFWHERGITRQLLHAYAIRFEHPTTQRSVEVTAAIPEDMQRWISGCNVEVLLAGKGGTLS
jgi:23S rRNA pseudouridine1911/1915/1917 synthase